MHKSHRRAIEGAPFAEGPRIPGRAPAGEPEAAPPAREGRPGRIARAGAAASRAAGQQRREPDRGQRCDHGPGPKRGHPERARVLSPVARRGSGPGRAAATSSARPADPGTRVKIGLWGSTASGKTTFLAALRHAMGSASGMGRWTVIPGNDISEKMLVDLTHTLVMRQEFPQATPLASQVELLWHFIGQFGHRAAGRVLALAVPS